MTFEEAAKLDADTHAGELDNGEWVPVTRNTWSHGEIMASVAGVLRAYAKRTSGWRVAVGDPGAKLRGSPDTLRGPDAAIIRSERRPSGKGAQGWLDGAPDVAVEILGDAQTTSELTKKALEYLAAGSKMVWLLDPEPQRVLLFTPPNCVRVLGKDDVLEGDDALPGFRCRVGELFE